MPKKLAPIRSILFPLDTTVHDLSCTGHIDDGNISNKLNMCMGVKLHFEKGIYFN